MDNTRGRKSRILNTRLNNGDKFHIRADISQKLRLINNLKSQEIIEVISEVFVKDG